MAVSTLEDFSSEIQKSGKSLRLPSDPIGNNCCWVNDYDGFLFNLEDGLYIGSQHSVKPHFSHGRSSTSLQINRTETTLLETEERTVHLTDLQTKLTNSKTFSQPIQRVHWHPASENHFCVLLAQSIKLCRVFDEFIQEEATYPLEDEIVDFSFGSHGWGTFSVVLLSEDGSVSVLMPLVPDGCILTETEFEELSQNLMVASQLGSTDVAEFETWLLKQFQKHHSTRGNCYFEYTLPDQLFFNFFSMPVSNNERATSGLIRWSNIVTLDANCGVLQSENQKYLKNILVLRVGKIANSSTGIIDFIASPYPFIPSQLLLNFFINLKTLEIQKDFPLLPFHITQHQQFVYLISRQTVHSIDISESRPFQSIILEDLDIGIFLDNLQFSIKCYLHVPEQSILGTELLTKTKYGSGLLVFLAPHKIYLIHEEQILDPIFEPSYKSVDVGSDIVLPPFNIEKDIHALQLRISQIFTANVFTNEELKLKLISSDGFEKVKKETGENFLSKIRDEVCNLHEELFMIQRKLINRMEQLKVVEVETESRRQQLCNLIDVTKVNMKQNKEEIDNVKTTGEEIKTQGKELWDQANSMIPTMSIQEILLQDEIGQAAKQAEFFEYKTQMLEEAADRLKPIYTNVVHDQNLEEFGSLVQDQQLQIEFLTERVEIMQQVEV